MEYSGSCNDADPTGTGEIRRARQCRGTSPYLAGGPHSTPRLTGSGHLQFPGSCDVHSLDLRTASSHALLLLTLLTYFNCIIKLFSSQKHTGWSSGVCNDLISSPGSLRPQYDWLSATVKDPLAPMSGPRNAATSPFS